MKLNFSSLLSTLIADLRFVIGLFFVLISLILLFAGATTTEMTNSVKVEGIGNLNFFSAGIMGIFGLSMLFMAWCGTKKR
jgi:hypothetical protein